MSRARANSPRRASRRRFLKTLGGAAAALPFLSSLPSHAETGGPAKRFVFLFTPNGTYWPEWFPTGGRTDFRLGRILEPLEPFRDHLTLFGSAAEPGRNVREEIGISIKASSGETSGGHGTCELVSGQAPVRIDDEDWPAGPSIDQQIASGLDDAGITTSFRSIELGVRVQGAPGSGKHVSYRDRALPMPAEKDAMRAFERLFGEVGDDDGSAARRLARNTRLTEYLHGRFGALRPQLSRADQHVLDDHVESLHEVESRLLSSASASCVVPSAPSVPGDPRWDDYSNMPEVMRQQIDNLALAFACDLTRVATLQITEAASNARYSFLTDSAGHAITDSSHGLSHASIDDAVAMDRITAIGRWHAEQLAYLLGRLGEIPDADGTTVLDNTVVLWVHELSDGRFHTHQRMPTLLAGRAGGALRGGQYLKLTDRSQNDLMLTCMEAMGVPAATFGDPALCTGPIADALT